jgi:hypothetical protein
MAQEYTSVPKIITRNISYFILNRINDNVSIDIIIKNHDLYEVDKDIFKKAYQLAIESRSIINYIDNYIIIFHYLLN